MSDLDAPPQPLATRREVFAWALYDWANSAYSTLAITVLVVYLIETANHRIGPRAGELIWGWGLGLTMLVAAVASPVLGAMADSHGTKRQWLAATALSGAAASALMFFATPDRPWLLVVLFLVANLGFELSLCFYNGFLPEIADERTMNRISAYGYALGYIGGGLALLLVIGLIFGGHKLGLPTTDEDHRQLLPRLGLLIMGLWWGLFSLPTIAWLRDKRPSQRGPASLSGQARTALREVAQTLRNIRPYRTLAMFLLAFLLYNDGVQTVISQASVFAKDVLQMTTGELVMVILAIQFVAMPGAWLVGRLADTVGQKPALILCLSVWIVLLALAFFIQTTVQFWCMALVAALVLGGTQSVSRAMMGRMTPAGRTAEFFGFFNLSGKATSVLGPIFFSTVLSVTGSAHWALASLLIFFILGWGIVQRIDVERGQREARAGAGLASTPRETRST